MFDQQLGGLIVWGILLAIAVAGYFMSSKNADTLASQHKNDSGRGQRDAAYGVGSGR